MVKSTLLEVMREHASSSPSRPRTLSHLHCWNGAQRHYYPVSYKELSQRAFAFGAILMGDKPKQYKSETDNPRVVMIACHSPYATLVAFYGAVSVGLIPMIFPMPLSLGSHEALIERIAHWGLSFEQPAMLVLEEGLVEKFHDDIPSEIEVLRISDDPTKNWDTLAEPALPDYRAKPSDIAFFQTTSSSTGDHKAVAISHDNIIANVNGIRRAQHMHDDERMSTWLPLFHDMGLVGTVLFSFCNDYNLFIMTPTQFVKRPALWLKGMHENECTIATAPNFGYDYCSRLVSEKDIDNLDLSKVKHLFIGAEPIRVSTIHSFVTKFARCGITPQTIRPAYGLAESTIIATMTPYNEISHFLRLDGGSIGINEPVSVLEKIRFDEQRLSVYEKSKDNNNDIAACSAGNGIENMHIEIVDENGIAVAEQGIAGEITIVGSSVALGYVDARSSDLVNRFTDGRLLTGDMGVLVDDELYIIERIKNLIIRNGENFLVSALEEQLAQILGISHDHIAVFESDIHNPGSDIVVLVERHGPIEQSAVDKLLVSMPKEAFPISQILLCKSREIPRTTSGKKRHFYCRKLYQKGGINSQQSISVSPQIIMEASARIKQP